ncbi:hypothetical protein BHE74_00015813 [Ensete ventricosum]|nr:hypothetical protein GW17_00004792 [Ensete ventricosum]RWW76123.1 hypothetical protein BHE74_00015813 [Ensete ventricosum]RZR98850.1 hypothetical protein BHM03_00028295 [Ensete ventricosum]
MDEGEETEIGEAGGESEGQLDHHVIGAVSGGAGEDEVGGNRDKDAQEEEKARRDHCMSSVGLVDAHPPEAGPEAP